MGNRNGRKKLEALRARVADHPTVTARVRAAMCHLKRFAFLDVENLLPAESEKQIRGVINAFKKAGEVNSIRPGYYEHFPKPKRRTLLDVIWHLVRSHRQFTTDDIERLSGAKRETALEYLHCLKKIGCLRQVRRGVWHLVNDPGPATPVNTAKCRRLKRIRQKAKTKKEISYGKA